MRGVVLWLFISTAALTQVQAPTVIRIDVNLVQLDAVVTDSKGRHVSDLHPEDFEVLQDGKPQTITNFSYVTSPGPPAAVPDTAPAKRIGPATPPLPAVPLKNGDVRRMFALVVDDLGMSFDSMAHTRDGLRKFVDHEMQPGDMVAIVRSSGGMGVLQQFTTDRTLLHTAIDHLKFTIGRVGVFSFAPLDQIADARTVYGNTSADGAQTLAGLGPGMAANGAAALDDQASLTFLSGTLGAIRYVVDGLRDMPGRKSVVLFSESMQIFHSPGEDPVPLAGADSDKGPNPVLLDGIRHLVDAANRASVVIYTIDPRGTQVLFPSAADNVSQKGAATAMMQRVNDMQDSQQGLALLADETGGLFIRNDNRLDDALHQAVSDTEGYYLIGYHPAAETFDQQGQPRFHNVHVRLKTAGLDVRSRSGFFGQADNETRTSTLSSHGELLHALMSPFTSGDVHVRLTTLFHQTAEGQLALAAILHIAPRDIQFAAQPDGGRKAAIEVAAMTFGESGQPVDQSDRKFDIDLTAAQYAVVQANGLVYQVNQPLQRPGMYQMRVALRDENSGKLGSASQFMQAPDLGNGRLAMSSIVLRAETMPAWTIDQVEGRVAGGDAATSTAERTFQPGTPLSYTYLVFNAQSDAARKTDLQVQTRIFRDGKPIYLGQPMAPNLAGQPASKRLFAGGNMVLSKAIPPGDYVLQVVVSDKLAKQKNQLASQWIDFTVRP